jgi:hypothetical protein
VSPNRLASEGFVSHIGLFDLDAALAELKTGYTGPLTVGADLQCTPVKPDIFLAADSPPRLRRLFLFGLPFRHLQILISRGTARSFVTLGRHLTWEEVQ